MAVDLWRKEMAEGCLSVDAKDRSVRNVCLFIFFFFNHCLFDLCGGRCYFGPPPFSEVACTTIWHGAKIHAPFPSFVQFFFLHQLGDGLQRALPSQFLHL